MASDGEQMIPQRIQLEAAQWYALAWRGCMAVSGLMTIVFIGRTLSPMQQGYYYTFESLVNLRVVAELGLSQVVLQVASHELARVNWTSSGLLDGDISAQSRLAKLLRDSFRWFFCVAFGFGAFVAIGGSLFFFTAQSSNVSWFSPWLALSVITAAHFLILPFIAIIEGLAHITQVMRLRLFDALISYTVLWLALTARLGLWALPAFYLSSFIVQTSWLVLFRRRALKQIWSAYDGLHADFWRREVLPFQWRLGVSWLSGYVVFHLLNLLVFRFSGPIDAGRTGMSLVLAQGTLTIGISVIRAKAPILGRLIASRNWLQLQRTWHK